MLASCLASEESVDHLLLNCKVAQAVWTSVLVWFDCSWTLSCSLHHLFEAWEMWLGSARRENYVEISLRLYGSYGKKGMQDVLKESLHRSTLCDKIKFFVASWVSILHSFHGVPMDFILHKWKEVAFS
eukprot:TRINITY_DN1202_c1_g1_i3.p2 TRINITY_DN1202_c1_g1~~TRINITY_DN1202_c1_g1_i3.p2  ORF type:complete len:128 (-),score=24.38 TRINITY_DN1202_c1_g1_i3:48-431(-)